MLGWMQNKGGQNTPQGMGQNPGLASLFGSNQAAAPTGPAWSFNGGQILPQIMAPTPPPVMPPAVLRPPVSAQSQQPIKRMSIVDIINSQRPKQYGGRNR